MTAEISLAIGVERLIVQIDGAGAPSLAAALAACVPHRTVAVHTQTAGQEFCVPVPFFHWHENRRPPLPSEVGYASFGNYICFYYGPMAEADGPTNVIGKATDADALARVGERLLDSGALPAVIEATGRHQVRVGQCASDSFSTVCQALLDEALGQPPFELSRVTSASIPAMGSMAARMQLSGFLMGLAEILFPIRQRLIAGGDKCTLLDLLTTALHRHARWLEMSGARLYAARLVAIADASHPDISDVAFLAGLETLLVAIGRLRLWNDALSPWHLLQRRFGNETWLNEDLRIK